MSISQGHTTLTQTVRRPYSSNKGRLFITFRVTGGTKHNLINQDN